MHQKKWFILVGLVSTGLIFLTLGALRFWSGEDNWICQDGQWITHGQPEGAKPTEPCKNSASTDPRQSGENGQEIKESLGDNIRIQFPGRNMIINSPLKINGLAKAWYFEGSFPVKLIDDNGKTLAQGKAIAKGDWMIDDFVPFEAELVFEAPKTRAGRLIFSKDNPSDLPENNKLFMLPILFDRNNR